MGKSLSPYPIVAVIGAVIIARLSHTLLAHSVIIAVVANVLRFCDFGVLVRNCVDGCGCFGVPADLATIDIIRLFVLTFPIVQ